MDLMAFLWSACRDLEHVLFISIDIKQYCQKIFKDLKAVLFQDFNESHGICGIFSMDLKALVTGLL